jgi:hypothetical protein
VFSNCRVWFHSTLEYIYDEYLALLNVLHKRIGCRSTYYIKVDAPLKINSLVTRQAVVDRKVTSALHLPGSTGRKQREAQAKAFAKAFKALCTLCTSYYQLLMAVESGHT